MSHGFSAAIAFFAVSIAPLAAFAQNAPPTTVSSGQAAQSLANMSPEQFEAFVTRSFRTLDRNSDGFITAGEAPNAWVTTTRNGQVVGRESGGSVWVRRVDGNQDGRVTLNEYRVYMNRMAADLRARR